jgi:hypothetical protein
MKTLSRVLFCTFLPQSGARKNKYLVVPERLGARSDAAGARGAPSILPLPCPPLRAHPPFASGSRACSTYAWAVGIRTRGCLVCPEDGTQAPNYQVHTKYTQRYLWAASLFYQRSDPASRLVSLPSPCRINTKSEHQIGGFGKACNRVLALGPRHGRPCSWGVGTQKSLWAASLLYRRSDPASRLVPHLSPCRISTKNKQQMYNVLRGADPKVRVGLMISLTSALIHALSSCPPFPLVELIYKK